MRLSRKQNRGQTLIVSIIFLAIVLVLAASLFSRVAGFLRFGSNTILREQATNIAEAGVDRAVWQLNQTLGSYSGESNTPVGTTGTFTVTITNKTASLKTITSTGYIPNATSPRAKRTIKVDVLISSSAISFRYAVQIGEGSLTMGNSSTINGSVYSNGNISGSGTSKINGDAYAVGTISSPDPTVTGTRNPGASPVPMPTVDYDYWRGQATNGGTIDCAITPTDCAINNNKNIGPKKYVGNLAISNNAIVTMQGPIYVTGNFSMSQGGTTLKLDNIFGSNSTFFIVDGTADFTQGGAFQPTNANPKGYIALATPSISSQAIAISQSGATAIFYALNGGATLSQAADVTAVVAKQLTMSQNSQLTFDTGLTSANFTSGPGGSWQIKRGTYKFTSSP